MLGIHYCLKFFGLYHFKTAVTRSLFKLHVKRDGNLETKCIHEMQLKA